MSQSIEEATHAVYAPSSAERWLQCPGSIKAAAEMHASGSEHNIYTASGSVIHAIGEDLLNTFFIAKSNWRKVLDDAVGSTWGSWCELEPEYAVLTVDNDMIDQAEEYLARARELYEELQMEDPSAVIDVFIETRVRFDDRLYGTADLIFATPSHIVVCDLKTGAGNMVWPEDNKQGLTYAGLYVMGIEYSNIPDNIWIAIIQPPHTNNVLKTWKTDLQTVMSHMNDVVMAMEQDHLKAGSWCRWCPARANCSKLHELATNAQSLNLDGMSSAGWKDALELAAILEPWCKQVKARATQLAKENGLNVPGYKLVDSYGRTTWQSEHAAGQALTEFLEDIVPLEDSPPLWKEAPLRTPRQVEDILKKALKEHAVTPEEIKVLLEGLTTTPHRGTVLVPASDKRPEVVSPDNLLQAASDVEFFK